MKTTTSGRVYQFNLRHLFLLIALAAVHSWMWSKYGWLGIVFILPLTFVAISAECLWSCGRKKQGAAIAAIYAVAWIHTSVAETTMLSQWLEGELAPMRKLASSPLVDESWRLEPPPWYYLGRTESPCPFIVCREVWYKRAPMHGLGAKTFYLSCAGYRRQIYFQFYWSS
jgi:hypothetical protein